MQEVMEEENKERKKKERKIIEKRINLKRENKRSIKILYHFVYSSSFYRLMISISEISLLLQDGFKIVSIKLIRGTQYMFRND
jgi:hypothetical protein